MNEKYNFKFSEDIFISDFSGKNDFTLKYINDSQKIILEFKKPDVISEYGNEADDLEDELRTTGKEV